MEIILGIIATEALVQLWFHAAPLQPMRGALIAATPSLYSESQETHLLNCKYCVSVWMGLMMATAYYTMPGIYHFGTIALAFHRASNFLHLIFSYLRDVQVDLRVRRK